MPRTLSQFKAHPWVEDAYRDDDGWWVHLKTGYWSSNMECGTLREDTMKELALEWESVEHAPIDYLKMIGADFERVVANWENDK